ncbi:MAG: hypothetical protein WKG07_00165 [Hymenobacter sp.]
MTVLELARSIVAATRSPSPITFIDRAGRRSSKSVDLDISLARRELGWEPQVVSWREGLALTTAASITSAAA